MSLTALALVLTAAFCHATWNFFVKKINGGPELIWLFSVVSSVLYLPPLIWVLISTKPVFDAADLFLLIGSVLLHLAYLLLLQIGYRKGDLSLVYPTARATGPLLSTSFAVLFLGEILSAQMALGAGIIIFSVLMLTGGFQARGEKLTVSLLFGLSVGVIIGSYTAWDAYAVAVLMIHPLILDYVTHIGRAIFLAPIAMKRKTQVVQHWREHRTGVLLIGLFTPLAYILVLYALTFTPVAYVAPTREVSVLLSVLAGSLLLGEGQLRWRLGWAAVIIAGMSMLITG